MAGAAEAISIQDLYAPPRLSINHDVGYEVDGEPPLIYHEAEPIHLRPENCPRAPLAQVSTEFDRVNQMPAVASGPVPAGIIPKKVVVG